MLGLTIWSCANHRATNWSYCEKLKCYRQNSGHPLASFDFGVQDNGGFDDGGGSEYSVTANTITFERTWVNQAPTGTDGAVATAINTPIAFKESDFGFADPNEPAPNQLLAVQIVSLPTAGILTLNGSAVVAGQFISVSDLDAGNLVFTPDADTSGLDYAQFQFRVQDNGGTADGGIDTDPLARTMIINVFSQTTENTLPGI